MIKVARPYFANKDLILQQIDRILDSGYLMNGPVSKELECEFASYVGSKHAIAVNSCTTALEITLRFIDVKDREVIVPSNTFIATGNAVIFAGGKPVLTDIKDGSYNIGLDQIKSAISDKTKAVIVVHIAGIVCDEIELIRDFCRDNDIVLIEDCAHAVGASFGEKKAGGFGLAGCFSFYPTKIMTTATGGMITTDSDELYEYACQLRYHGRGNSGNIEYLGNDWFMDEIRAALGLYQLRDIGNMLSTRRNAARMYSDKLKDIEQISIFIVPSQSNPSFYKYVVQLDRSIEPDNFRKSFEYKYHFELESVYWPPCHLQPVYKNLFDYRLGDFPVTERTLSHQITLPMHSLITEGDVDQVVCYLKEHLCG